MKCQLCGQPATVHLTDIVKKKKREVHLCEACARDQNLIPDGPAPALNLPALVGLLMGQPATSDPAALTCPHCGLKYAMFRADGRLGCPHDYDAFATALEPLLFRIHRGTKHAGKSPRAEAGRAEIADLRDRLAKAVAAENYEDAAVLRDRIRHKEARG